MAKHRTRVGLDARNDVHFPEPDYALIRRARVETLKTMSFTDASVYGRIRRENPDIEFIVRLYDERLGQSSRPSPADFVAKMVSQIHRLKPYALKFEIHNEPNHASGLEGWGASDENARAFRAWYLQVLPALKRACPWARFGFPGLALNQPHRDLAWLEICRDAIQASDWLGCHCYWQHGNMMSEQWGLRFKLYHERFPKERIEITEFGDSTPNRPREEIAHLYVQYYQEVSKYPYLGSASAFIASSPDPAWRDFVWAKESGEMLPVVHAVANMERKAVEVAPKPKPKHVPKRATERLFPQTGKTVRDKFLEFVDRYGLDITGYPITSQFEEEGLPSQYFQRVGLEQTKSGGIRLKMVGSEAWTSRSRITELEARIAELVQLPTSTGPARPAIEDIVGKLLTHPTQRYPTRSLGRIGQIVIHHTATNPAITPERLAQYQVKTLGLPGIKYHFVVAADGTLYQTNRLDTVPDHAYSRNVDSIGICFPGNFTEQIPTEAQLEAGGRLCAWLLSTFRLPTQSIVGVGEFVNSESPGKQWLEGARWKDKLLALVEAALEAGDPSALVASLQERILALGQEIAELQEQAAEPAEDPTPPAAPKISRPAIQNLIGKLTTLPTKQYETRPVADIQCLVIHHSAVAPSAGPRRIADYHVRKLEWPGIGYHFLVGEDGILYQSNALETISFHAVQANRAGVGICFLGSFMKKVPPSAQLRAGAHLAAWLIQELDLTLDDVVGHQEVLDTRCPGDQWLAGEKWKEMLRQAIVEVQREASQREPETEPEIEAEPETELEPETEIEAEPETELEPETEPEPEAKPIYHYMLFWNHNGERADKDWASARNYVAVFAPTAGFSVNEAVHAQYVTIVGGPASVARKVEEWLKAAGCKVDYVGSTDKDETKRQLDSLAEENKRFRSFDA